MSKPNMIFLTGQEGTGKTTLCRALLSHTPNAAAIDAEDLGQTNPWEMDDQFIRLLWKNVISVIHNFLDAGITNIIAGSFFNTKSELQKFVRELNKDAQYYVVHLCAPRETRDVRRMERPKPTTEEWRDWSEQKYPEDTTLQDADFYHYVRIENGGQSVDETVEAITRSIPEIFS